MRASQDRKTFTQSMGHPAEFLPARLSSLLYFKYILFPVCRPPVHVSSTIADLKFEGCRHSQTRSDGAVAVRVDVVPVARWGKLMTIVSFQRRASVRAK